MFEKDNRQNTGCDTIAPSIKLNFKTMSRLKVAMMCSARQPRHHLHHSDMRCWTRSHSADVKTTPRRAVVYELCLMNLTRRQNPTTSHTSWRCLDGLFEIQNEASTKVGLLEAPKKPKMYKIHCFLRENGVTKPAREHREHSAHL